MARLVKEPGRLEDYHNRHRGQTCLIIGNGPSLGDLPNSFLEKYPSFGSNLINRREGFTASYYVAVDSRIMVEYQVEVMEKYRDIPKFLPSPNLDKWVGPKIYRFRHRPGPLWPHPDAGPIWPRSFLSTEGITFITVTHALLQLAYFMGFKLMLCVGLDNTGDGSHFYGPDYKGYKPDVANWDKGYKELYEGFMKADPPREIVNISTYTEADGLPISDWRRF